MNTMVKNVFIVVGTMMFSVLVYSVMFGDVGRSFMWSNMEPMFQKNWNRYTMNDGDLLTERMVEVFDNAESLSGN